jgi:glycosyltransferase involved in cell wall biosynthesis
MQEFFRTFSDIAPQTPFDAAVVIPTTLRPTLGQALACIFAQNFRGTIQILVGIDTLKGDLAAIEAACAQRPRNVAVHIFWPGYSTARRHGGVMRPGDGGALRTILTFLANSPYVAYLDDDNWWGPNHLKLMRAAIAQAEWAFALRWFVHPETRKPVHVDEWESLGPGAGHFQERFGGFVDPNCLMINKLACPQAAQFWCMPMFNNPMLGDRAVFEHLLKNHKARGTGRASVFYTMNASDGLHPIRIARMKAAYEAAGHVESAREMVAV